MSVRSTVDLNKVRALMQARAAAVLAASEAELNERIGQRLHDRMKDYAPVDTGELWNSIVLVSAGGAVPLVSGSIIVGVGRGAGQIHVVSYAPYSVYVNYGSMHGHIWRPPNPYVSNAVADVLGSFAEIVNIEAFAPFKGGSGWREIETANAGTANTFSPLAGPAE